MCVEASAFTSEKSRDLARSLARSLSLSKKTSGFGIVVICDDSEFTARNLDNWLWVTFTRSNPSHDIYGVSESIELKHWGCDAPMIIDARLKPHHAWPLEEDPETVKKVEKLAAPSGSLHGII
jgi:4-hydroxy-3-polyprenylbenzoate decarboxylase